MQTLRYGPSPDQEDDLHLTDRPRPPVVCLLHGGFWSMPYGRDQMSAVARDLAARGIAVWNIEYRRLGAPGGGWPGTLQDVADAIDHLAVIAGGGIDIDLNRVFSVGHSAGGQLALWVAGRPRLSAGDPGAAPRVRIAGVCAQAAVSDLVRAQELRLGGEVVNEFLGGTPGDVPERYRMASPLSMLPLGVPQLILHGTADDAVPVGLSRAYADAARAAGDPVEFVALPAAGHFAYLDPASDAHAALVRWLKPWAG